MEYSFPNKGYAKITSQFMLGDDILVAPVLVKGHTTKLVYVPEGKRVVRYTLSQSVWQQCT